MSDTQRTSGHRTFEPEGPGTSDGGDVGTRDRARGTGGPRAADRPSPEELAARAMSAGAPGHADESTAAVADKGLRELLPGFDNAELARLAILEPGTPLEQGGVYLDLNDRERGPVRAIGGQAAGPDNRYVAKRDTDFELWNRLAGRQAEPDVERPSEHD